MELEEIKIQWAEMSSVIEKQKKLTDSLIIKMTKSGYRNKINTILIPEIAGALACFTAFIFILLNFQQLNKWYLVVCGIIAGIILFILPVLSLKVLFKMRSLNIRDNNYMQSVMEYSKEKLNFVFIQKINFYMAAVLLLVALPVMGQLIGGKDLFKESRLWYFYAISFPFFYLFSKWVLKRYKRSAKEAENILLELKEQSL
ncbi:hypothetical protein BH11BAC4_BH11BAC4_01920 [soil metagenome]